MSRSTPNANRDAARIRHLLTPLLRGQRLRLTVMAMCSLGGGLAEATVLVLIARIAFALTRTSHDVQARLGPFGSLKLSVPAMLAIAATAVGIKLALQVLVAWQTARVATELTAERRRRLAGLFLEASWDVQSNERQGHLQELTTTYVSQATGAVVALVTLGVNALNLVALLGTAVVLNLIAALAATGVVIALALALRPLRAATRRRSRRAARANLSYATATTEVTAQAKEIRIFNVTGAAFRRLDREITTHAWAQSRTMLVSRIVAPLYQSAALALIVALLAVVYAVGSTRLAALSAIVLILLRSLSYGQAVQTNYQSLHESAPYVEALANEEERYRAAAISRDGASVERIDEIAFEGVWFEYEAKRPILRDISFTAHRGQVIGIIGPSGSGKSTLVQLLLRLREPLCGTMLADGRASASLALTDWYERIAFVPQEAQLFNGTVAENIGFFRSVDGAAIERAAKLAHLHDDIVAWSAGYETPVGERGGQLSGGQRQRLCIARSVVGEPDVLVLDEPTSALDARSESLIRETLTGLASRMLIVIIAHRLSTLDICDRIMVLEDGEIRGFDEPRHLEASSAFYQEALRLAGLK